MVSNALITAWNDSGAGYLIRCLDHAPGIFAYPFEVLLGAPVPVGINNCPDLVKACYRWNIFRNPAEMSAHWRDSPPSQLSNVFGEDELQAWIKGEKFTELQSIRTRVSSSLQDRFEQETSPSLSEPAFTIRYLDVLENQFAVAGLHAKTRVIHCPCMMLDAAHELFFDMFPKVITVSIHPAWGFGNMHRRNGISLDRYLERWRAINLSALSAVTQFPETVLSIQTSPLLDQNLLNAERAYKWMTGSSCERADLHPSLLGLAGSVEGYPYGGLWAVNPEASASATETTQKVLAKTGAALKDVYDECIWIFDSLAAQ